MTQIFLKTKFENGGKIIENLLVRDVVRFMNSRLEKGVQSIELTTQSEWLTNSLAHKQKFYSQMNRN